MSKKSIVNYIIGKDDDVDNISGINVENNESDPLEEEKTKIQRENELLVNLMKQFGLTKSVTNSLKRGVIWDEITKEFNRINNCHWEKQKLKNRFKNWGLKSKQ